MPKVAKKKTKRKKSLVYKEKGKSVESAPNMRYRHDFERCYNTFVMGAFMYAIDSGKVLVRAYGDEPRLMFLGFNEDGKSVVYESSAENSIPYPITFIYEADDELFALLNHAYTAADDVQLRTLWTKARHFTLKEPA